MITLAQAKAAVAAGAEFLVSPGLHEEVMDRAHSATSQIVATEFDWEGIFQRDKVTWFHTGGIFAGLSESTAEAPQVAMLLRRDTFLVA